MVKDMQFPGVSPTDSQLLIDKSYKYRYRYFEEEYDWVDPKQNPAIVLSYFRWRNRLLTNNRMHIYNTFLRCIPNDNKCILMAAKLLISALTGKPYTDDTEEKSKAYVLLDSAHVYTDLHSTMMETDYKLSTDELKIYQKRGQRLDIARHLWIYRNLQRNGYWTTRDLLSMAADYVPEIDDYSPVYSRFKMECVTRLLNGCFFPPFTQPTDEYPEMSKCF